MALTKVIEGKTKVIWDAPDYVITDSDAPHVFIESKDDITAGDGAKRDQLEGKAAAATATTCNVFELLNNAAIKTHYIARVDERIFSALKVEMIPLELVVRRVATGSYLKRNPDAVEGEVFEDLVFEIFHKDDDAHDPILVFGSDMEATRYPADQPEDQRTPIDVVNYTELELGRFPEETVEQLEETTRSVFLAIEEAWAEQNVQLIDLKIECGWTQEGHLVVADVIDNDSWRIWPAGDKSQMKDKQVYRDLAETDDPKAKAKELGKIKQNYQWVAEATGQFVT